MARDDATRRFSDRVGNYVRYRPHYPSELIDLLERECGLAAGSSVADVGSGTGILAEPLLRRGCRVFGVEPNREMREAGERQLAGYTGFTSVDGRAEATTLPDASVDLVTAGQAFHWFDRVASRGEFVRILKAGGWAALVWNKRLKTGTAYLEAYERLLQRWSIDYAEVDHDRVTDDLIEGFFAPNGLTMRSFKNRQELDFEGTRGRLESSSYAPAPDHPNYEPMIKELRAVFAAHSETGRVAYEYDTVVYFGHLDPRR